MAKKTKKKAGKKASNKTQATASSVTDFIKAITPDSKREDAQTLLKLFKDVTGETPVMWGTSIIGFGQYHYRYDSGREGDSMMIGFSPRKQNIVIYIMPGFSQYTSLLETLGPVKTSVSCLYLTKLENIHLPTLKKLSRRAYQDMKKKYG